MAALIDPHTASRKSVVEYFYDGDIGNYYYGAGHPMKPHRVRLTHHLLLTTGLYRKMNVFRPSRATKEEMQSFHKSEYLDFLKLVNVDNIREFASQMGKFNVGQDDCPMFDDLYEYCSIYSGGTLSGACRINEGKSDVVINWSGGMHHAKKGEASGFCYVNDIVLGCLELLKRHQRVLYIDIDIHHGDGVEEAFYSTNRVMTLSFHQYGDFFPGTGNTDQIGHGEGKGYALNVPLQEGLDDSSFESIFRPIVDSVMQRFDPGAVVMCCGADSITGDRLGCWNLTIKGHAACIEYVRRFGKPVMLLGGGGYTPRNVARCWTYETSIVVGGEELDDDLPFNDYYEYFAPGYKLHLPIQKNLPNTNGPAYLEQTKQIVLQTLSQLEAVPSVPIFTGQAGTTQIPTSGQNIHDRHNLEKDSYHPDSRVTNEMLGKKEASGEYSSNKGKLKTLEEAAKGWKIAPKGEPEEDGL